MKRPRSVIPIAIAFAAATIAASRAESAPRALDVVDLVDGTQIVGVVTHREQGKYVTVVTAAGEQHMIPWARLALAPPAPSASSATPSP
jgi:hypothetical protein